MKVCPVIIAGGNGTRLWPMSREARPKQFLSLHGHYTMLQTTAKRLENLDIQPSVTVCNEEHRFFVAEQLRNIGTGVDVTIRELTETIADVVGFKGYIKWDVSKPDGTARKLLNVKLIEKLGWRSTVTLRSGLERTYDWFVNQTDYRN
jgi:NDP-sugar pyrophosphorylase family protein